MKRTLTAIVVEDERLPRLSLLRKLEDFRPQVEVVDSCDNYDSALQSILRHRPDVLLLDIQLQGRDSMQLLNELKDSMALPYVIFTTAYSDRRYLMQAIKLSAVDFLLKPVDKNELAMAIAKVVGLAGMAAEVSDLAMEGKVAFKTVSGKVFVEKDDIAYVRADGNYATVVTFHGKEMVMESLAKLEQKLDKGIFVRADRSMIVNVKRIYKLNPKKRICTLMTTDAPEVKLELSKSAMDTLYQL